MTPEERAAVVAEYEAGMKIREICEAHDCHAAEIYRSLAVAGLSPGRYPLRAAHVLEDAEWLADHSRLTLHEVCQRISRSRDTFWKLCWRRNRLDLYWLLADREPDAEQRRAVREGIRRSREVA